MDYKTLRREIETIETLPTLPSVLTKLLRVIENPKVSLKEIGHVISNDPVLTTRVLRAVNSPLYGFPGRIASINQSLVLLGVNLIRGLLLGVSVFEAMKKALAGLWEHSVGCATAARVIGQKIGLKEPDEVAVAALLHDIGKVIFSLKFPAEYERVLEDVTRRELFVFQGEKEAFEINHADAGGWIALKWHFPAALTEIIEYHHTPHLSRQVPLATAVVHLADILVRARGFGFAGDPFVPAINPQAWELLQLSEANLRDIVRELDDSLDVAGDFLSLE